MDVLTLVSALGIGSAIGTTVGTTATHFLTSGRERRETRSIVFQYLTELERRRWVNDETYTKEELAAFNSAIRDFQTAALIARIRFEIAEQYVVFAATARLISATAAEDNPNPDDGGGSISQEISQLTYKAVDEVNNYLWSPFLASLTYKRTTAARKKRALESRDEELQYMLPLAARRIGISWEMVSPTG